MRVHKYFFDKPNLPNYVQYYQNRLFLFLCGLTPAQAIEILLSSATHQSAKNKNKCNQLLVR